ncbi:MAG: hypothetical protein BWK78_04655 [Thiotrichaceae bacterium IS1]|nr:MAG: hypothetical protein BWK78_04655 [Thiotrichaceae bacterium IS1]
MTFKELKEYRHKHDDSKPGAMLQTPLEVVIETPPSSKKKEEETGLSYLSYLENNEMVLESK